MEKRIELEKRARKPIQITELNLDNCRSTSIVGLTDEYTALETLSLINVGLTTLKGFPKLPSLKKLELSDNRISSGLNYLTTSPKLQYLNLSGNKIKDLETLKPLQEFKNLAVLDLFNNEATTIENYRDKIFEMLPSLKFLDGFDSNDVEAPSDGEDDDEVNGNDYVSDSEEDGNDSGSSDDDKRNAFCLNGLEIDLDELEAFEKRVRAKKASTATINASGSTNQGTPHASSTETTSTNNHVNEETDDLDEYLRKLKLNEEQAEHNKEDSNPKSSTSCALKAALTEGLSVTPSTSNRLLSRYDDMSLEPSTSRGRPANTNRTSATETNSAPRTETQFIIFLYWFLAILNLASAAYPSDAMGEDDADGDEDGDDDDDVESDDEDNGDVSLAEVYNDDLEEDNSDWEDKEGAEDDDEDEDDSDEEGEGAGDANKSATTAAAAPKEGDTKETPEKAGDEQQARGKKRKFDG